MPLGANQYATIPLSTVVSIICFVLDGRRVDVFSREAVIPQEKWISLNDCKQAYPDKDRTPHTVI